ncbi:MAG: TolC family protein [Acidobacteriota bacterium]
MNIAQVLTLSIGLSYALMNGTLAALASSAAHPARSQPSNAKDSSMVMLEDLIGELIQRNPELQAFRKGYEAAQTRPSQEKALPEPRLTFGWISNGNPLPGTGLGVEPTSNVGFQIAQEFPYSGKRELKAIIAGKEAHSLGWLYQAKELELVRQLKQSFYGWQFTDDALRLVDESHDVLRQMARVAEASYASGKGIQQDLIRIEVEISILDSRRVLLRQKQQTLQSEINTMVNQSPERTLGRPQPVFAVPQLLPFENLVQTLSDNSPVLRAQRDLVDSRHFGIAMAKKEYYPDLDLMGGYYNMGGMRDMWEFKFQLKVPVYFWQKQRSGLEEASYRLVEAQKTHRASEQALKNRLREQYLAAQAAEKLMQLYRKRIVPQSRLALQSALASYESGMTEFVTVLTNANTILDYEMSYLEQRAEFLKAVAALEEITGMPFEASR